MKFSIDQKFLQKVYQMRFIQQKISCSAEFSSVFTTHGSYVCLGKDRITDKRIPLTVLNRKDSCDMYNSGLT